MGKIKKELKRYHDWVIFENHSGWMTSAIVFQLLISIIGAATLAVVILDVLVRVLGPSFLFSSFLIIGGYVCYVPIRKYQETQNKDAKK